MSEKSSAVAFKEWASVVHSLGLGQQIFVLRKGGIHESRGGFTVDHKAFWLFPTKFHEQTEKVKEGTIVPDWIQDKKRTSIPLRYWAQLEEYCKITDRGELEGLSEHHVWANQTIEEKFTWGPEKTVYLLFLRVFEIAEIIDLEDDKKYGGCKSWIELPVDFTRMPSRSVLTDDFFEAQKEEILKKIKKS